MKIGELLTEAKDALKGNWTTAVLSNIVMGILQFAIAFVAFMIVGGVVFMALFTIGSHNSIGPAIIGSLFLYFIVIFSIAMVLVLFQTGYQYAVLDAVDTKKMGIMDFLKIFKQQPLKVLGLLFVSNILIFLWTLLFIIPGIIKTFSYSQAILILKENPEMGIMDCITRSRQMMDGYKFTLFGATFIVSFIAYLIPSIMMQSGINYNYSYNYYSYYNEPQFGMMYYIGTLLMIVISIFLVPYLASLYAVFYRRLTGSKEIINEENNRENELI